MKKTILLGALMTIACNAAFATAVPNTYCTESSGTVSATNSKGQCSAGKTPVTRRANASSTAAPGESQGGPVANVVTFKPVSTRAKTATATSSK
jgi:hypothetical protein